MLADSAIRQQFVSRMSSLRLPKALGSPLGWIGVCILGAFVLLAVAAPLIAPYEPYTRVAQPFERPSLEHPLGANDIGHDLLSELIYGARVSLSVGIVTAVLSAAIGTIVAVVAGYFRGPIDALAMRVVDIALALPFLPLMIVMGVFLGAGLATEIIVISSVIWARTARELRSQVLSVRERGHVQAARAMGASGIYVISRHIIPRVFPLVIPQVVRTANVAIMLEASLSFLGLGDPLAKSWGTTLFFANARAAFLTDAWLWWVLPAGLCIALVVVSFAFIGFSLEEAHKPTFRPGKSARPAQTDAASAAPVHETRHGTILSAENLFVVYHTPSGDPVRAVDGVSISIGQGQTLGIVGESGCGKSTLAAALLRMVPPPGEVLRGSVRFDGKDLYSMSKSELRSLRGSRITYVPQSAMNVLNPVISVGKQISEVATLHSDATDAEAKRRAKELLEQVGIDPSRYNAYPHEFSGGMRQRAVIAMAIANRPSLIIADESTTGLDVITQHEIVQLLADLRAKFDSSMLLITHDLSLALRTSDTLAVMHEGRIVEQGTASKLRQSAEHPYTRQLFDSIPSLHGAGAHNSKDGG